MITYHGIYVVAFRQVLQPTILHWGIFIGPNLDTSGTLHNYVNRFGHSYHYEEEENYNISMMKKYDLFVIGHRVGEISTRDALLFKSKLAGMIIPPGSDCQRWVFTALNHLQKQLLGWIDVSPLVSLTEHMPCRERARGVFHSTMNQTSDFDQLDADDHCRNVIVNAGQWDLWRVKRLCMKLNPLFHCQRISISCNISCTAFILS